MARRLRIAAAGFFVLLAVGFVALWVRSYHKFDILSGPLVYGRFHVASHYGAVAPSVYSGESLSTRKTDWSFNSSSVSGNRITQAGKFGFSFVLDGEFKAMTLPHWFLAASSLAVAALFAFKRTWRFSVRGLLIATTVVAAMLGLVVYADR